MSIQLNGSSGLSVNALPFLVGQVCFFAMASAPPGFEVCDGGELDRTTHSSLFSVTGTLYGAGNGTTTFNKPQLLGEFIRGWDGGRGVDPGRQFGSWQEDNMKAHNHDMRFRAASEGSGGITDPNGFVTPTSDGDLGMYTNTVAVQNAGGVETRSRNVALLPCIFTGVL